jgi:hypothetical protein
MPVMVGNARDGRECPRWSGVLRHFRLLIKNASTQNSPKRGAGNRRDGANRMCGCGVIDADAAFDGAQLASLDPLEDVDLARAVPERCDRLEIPAVKMSTLRGAGRADARRSGFT